MPRNHAQLVAFWLKCGARGVLRRLWLSLTHVNDPWEATIDVHRPAVRKMVARARLDRRREAGVRIVRRYSRDPVVEQRELRIESPFQKFQRYARAQADKVARDARMVV